MAEPEMPRFVLLAGPGPHQTEIAESVELALGELMAVVSFKLVDGQTIQVPLGHQAVIDLHQLTGQVLDEFEQGLDGAPQ